MRKSWLEPHLTSLLIDQKDTLDSWRSQVPTLSGRTKNFENFVSEGKKKLFLCGEDITVLDNPRISHFYYPLTKILKIDRICLVCNVDRVYYSLSRKFFEIWKRLLRNDIIQNYPAAIFGLITGSFILIIYILLG